MGEVHLSIPAVYSAYHADPTQTLAGMRLLQHQVETLEALNDPDVDVVINTAMTGDGKSLAGYLLAFRQAQRIIAMYPTNELIRDQHAALQGYREKLARQLPADAMMFGERITQLMRDHEEKSRLEEVKKLLMNHGILLTNPDLVHLIMSHQYGWGFMLKELPVVAGANFDYFLFDEFHTFAVPQVISVVNMLGYLRANYKDKPREQRKYLFLSATPTPFLEKMLARGGLRSKVIQGHYGPSEQGGEYRCILQPCTISLEAISQERSTEQWVEEHLPQLLAFFRQNEKAKAAILVYSPATARRLVTRLRTYFEPFGITVGENTGLTPTSERRAALMQHILVGTSTVDIGIDFHINYLIFEAFNAGSFLQRFGRLGRHAEFSEYRAYALVPPFIRERLAQAFEGQAEVERVAFNSAVREAYPTEQEFAGYTQRWGVVQAAHVLTVLKSQQQKDQNQGFYAALIQQYEQIYGGTPEKSVMDRAVKKYWKTQQHSQPVLDDLLSFRGQSPLSCGVWDTTTSLTQAGGSLLTYDLFFLLANTEFEVIDEDIFMQEVQRRSLEERDFRKKRFYLKVHAYVPERHNLILRQKMNLSEYSQLIHQLTVCSGLTVYEPRHTWLNEINKRLKQLHLTCIISDLKPQELKLQFKLGGIFPVYRLLDDLGSEYSIVFGQEAILLDSLLAFRKPKGNNAMMA